jgi:energy-coupling factor transport system permease protein
VLKKSFKYYLFTAITIAIINPLVSHRGTTIIFYLFENPITLEACFYGLISSVCVVNIFLIFMSFNSVFSYHKLLYLFSKFAPSFTMIVTICLRFIPTLKDRLKDIILIQKCKGSDTNRGNIIERIKGGLKVFDSLIVISLEESMQTADSIKARGYGATKRTSYLKYKLSNMDLIILIINLLLFIIILIGFYNGYGKYDTYPTIQRINVNIYYLLLFFTHLLIPFIIDKERTYYYANN